MEINRKVDLYSEENSVLNNKIAFGEPGERCLIVTSLSAAKKSGALADVTKALENYDIHYEIFNEVKQNPSIRSCIIAGKKANEFKADYIIGIGGGSALDAAKITAVVANNPDIDEDSIYSQSWANNPLPFILVSTTAGTGSEVTNVAVITNSQGQKQSIKNDLLYARYAFGDPRYTQTMPVNIEVSTAIDAFAHLLESYFSNNATEESRKISVDGIKLLYPYLKRLNEDDLLTMQERKEIYDASILGGRAIDITGTVFCHKIGYYFTENFKIPHGFASALFLNGLIDYELKTNRMYTRDFFKQVEINPEELKKQIAKTTAHIRLKVFKSDLDKIIDRFIDSTSIKNTFQNIKMEEIIEIIKERFN